jgi:hypothetical protein
MKDPNPSLDRLLRAAARQQPAGSGNEEPPFGFATRVIAGWQAGLRPDRQGTPGLEALWFRRSLVCALAVMAITVGWSFKANTASPDDELAIVGLDSGADIP